MKMKANCSMVRIVRWFDCGRLMRSAIAVALCAVGLSAAAENRGVGKQWWLRDYNDEFWCSTPDSRPIKDSTDVIEWGLACMAYGDSSAKHGKFLEASTDAMIAAYDARIAKDSTDCEAYICRAIAHLKKAGENPAFFDLAKGFGYTFSNDTMHFTGELIHEKGETPEMNDATKAICDILLPQLNAAFADLSAIPQNWKGSVAITPDVYPVDDETYFDWADVLAAKACLAEMLCVLNMVKGFDVTLDSDKLADTFNSINRSNGKRGVQAILENNPDFLSKVRDQKALTEAAGWWASAATLMDQWDKAHCRRSDGKQHFFQWDFEKGDSNTQYGINWLRTQSDELANLPYWASPIDFTKINGDRWQFLSFKPIFEGKFLREDFPQFGVGVKEPWYNEPLIDTCPDSSLRGIFVSVSPTYLATYVSTRWTDIPSYTNNSQTASVYGIWYTNMFSEAGIGFDNKDNPRWFAWNNETPIQLEDPTFKVNGVTAKFKGWSGVMCNLKKVTTWEGSDIPTPIEKEPMKYIDRKAVLTAHFDIPKVIYLDFDETTGKMVGRTNECEFVTENTTTFETGKVYVVVGDVTATNCIHVLSTPESPAKLVLCDGVTLTATKGVEVSNTGAATNALIICGQALGTGTLEATGTANAAGIGGAPRKTGGMVTINGGTVTATGGKFGAGIGGGARGAGGSVTINGGTVTAMCGESGVAAIGAGWMSDIAGTVKFGAGYACGVAAGADEANALYMTPAAYAADHSAAYVALPYFALKIPEAEGYSYAVSYEGAQPNAVLADQTNTYAIATGVTARVRFTLGDDYVWAKEPEDNPILIKGFSRDTVLGEGDLPTVKYAPKGSEENPWTIGEGVTAYTNGTEFVIEGNGTITDLSKVPSGVKGGIKAITIGAGVTGAASETFAGLNGIALTLPDGWQGERPDAGGDWYGATNVKLAGGMNTPWEIGEGVTAYTNGTEFVIEGNGTITDLSKVPSGVKGGIKAITIGAGVTGAASGVFADFGSKDAKVALTLADGWQGELPDDAGNWYDATDIELMNMPLAVKNVTFLQRYPWNGLVDISCDLTGSGEVELSVTVLTNGVKLVEKPVLTGETVIGLGDGCATNGVKFIWDARKDLPAGFKAQNVKVKVTAKN